jgi:hypothetical protein
MANFYLDEDLLNFVEPLRLAGHNIVHARDVGPGRTDTWHLAAASRQQRIFVTFNDRDYRYLHRLWTSLRVLGLLSRKHSGILSVTAQLEPSAWVPAIASFFDEGKPVHERMWTWHPAIPEWREDRWKPED